MDPWDDWTARGIGKRYLSHVAFGLFKKDGDLSLLIKMCATKLQSAPLNCYDNTHGWKKIKWKKPSQKTVQIQL